MSFPNRKDFIVCDPVSRISSPGEWTPNNKAAGRRLVVELSLCHQKNSGAGEGIRTLDPDLGKVVLYH